MDGDLEFYKNTPNIISFKILDCHKMDLDINNLKSILLTVKKNCDNCNDDSTAIIKKDKDLSGYSTGDIININFSIDDLNHEPGEYVYDFKIIDINGKVSMPKNSPFKFIIKKVVTNRTGI